MIDIHGNVVAERFMIRSQAGSWVVRDTETNRNVLVTSFHSWCETCIERLSGRYDGMVDQWFKHYGVKA